jgi:hypothetical protein
VYDNLSTLCSMEIIDWRVEKMKNLVSCTISGVIVGMISSAFGFSVWAALACMVVGMINGIIVAQED